MYKVVREDVDGTLWGAFIGWPSFDNPYVIGEWKEAEPEMLAFGLGLMYYRYLAEAREFRDKYTSWFLPLHAHRCEVEGPMGTPELIVCAHKTNSWYDMHWRAAISIYRCHPALPGTLMAKALKLGTRV